MDVVSWLKQKTSGVSELRRSVEKRRKLFERQAVSNTVSLCPKNMAVVREDRSTKIGVEKS